MTALLTRLMCLVLAIGLGTAPLSAQSAAARPAMDPAKLKAVLMNVPTGSPLRLRTRDGAELAGKLTQLTNDGVQIQALVGGTIENRSLAFGEIAALKAGPRKPLKDRILGPVLTVSSLAGTIAAITAAVKK